MTFNPLDPNTYDDILFDSEDSDFDETLEFKYPLEHVQNCIEDKKLQKELLLPDNLKKVEKHCDVCENIKLKWYRFRSTPITWQHLCGVESWLLVCPKCMQQYDEVILKVN